MNQIKFDKRFSKLLDIENGDKALLLEVFDERVKDLSLTFRSYDTYAEDGTYYKLPDDNEDVVVLLFYHYNSKRLFPTVRLVTPNERLAYLKSRGVDFEVVIKSESVCQSCFAKNECSNKEKGEKIDCSSATLGTIGGWAKRGDDLYFLTTLSNVRNFVTPNETLEKQLANIKDDLELIEAKKTLLNKQKYKLEYKLRRKE